LDQLFADLNYDNPVLSKFANSSACWTGLPIPFAESEKSLSCDVNFRFATDLFNRNFDLKKPLLT